MLVLLILPLGINKPCAFRKIFFHLKNSKYVANQCVQSIKKQKGCFTFEGQM